MYTFTARLHMMFIKCFHTYNVYSISYKGDGNEPPPPPSSPPLGAPEGTQFWAQATEIVTMMMAALPHRRDRGEAIGCSSTNFARHTYPIFKGSEDPLAVDHWLIGLEDLMENLSCTKRQKVKYGPLRL